MVSRVRLLTEILQFSSDHHIRLNRFWGNFVETARFKLGESIKDLKIPFALDSESTEVIHEAIDDLVEFLKRRQESQFKAPGDHSIDDIVTKVRLAPKTFHTRLHRPGSLEFEIISRALLTDPLLDAGIFETWFAQKNSGNRLLAILQGILHKSMVEEIKSEHLEKTAYIACLALLKHINQAKSIIKKKSIKGIAYEQLDVTTSNVLYIAVDAVLSGIAEQLKKRKIAADIDHTFLLLGSVCHPLTFTAIKQSITRPRFNPYNITQELVDLLDHLYRQLSQRDTDVSFIMPQMSTQILDSGKFRTPVFEAVSLLHTRRAMLEFLFENDSPSVVIAQQFRALVQDQGALHDLAGNSKACDALADDIRAILKQSNKVEKRTEQLLVIETLVRHLPKTSAPKEIASLKKWIEPAIDAYFAYKIDLYLDPFTTEAVNILDNRQQKLTVSQLKADYESGRVYRVSTDSRPILNEFSETFSGQLFIDLKDFTKRTNFSKEIVVAEFLGSEFYKPILDAAKSYYSASEDAHKSIRLINLLGDAVIFSGNIESLVYLAQDIQNIFNEYRKKLKANNPTNLENEMKEKIEAKFKNDLQEVHATIDKIQKKSLMLQEEMRRLMQENVAQWAADFPQRLTEEITRSETDFVSLDLKLSAEADSQRRYEYFTQKNQATHNITYLKDIQKQFVGNFRKMTPEQQQNLLFKFYGRELLMEKSNLDELLDSLKKRELTIRHEFERELKRIEGFGMDAGLFISYGKSAETVPLQDEIWGDLAVAIAESINESARGTARNSMIKKMLEARLSEQARLRGKPDLAYAFHVFVEKTYSFQLSPQQNAEFHSSLKNSALPQAEQILHGLLYDGLKDIREMVANPSAQTEKRSLVVIRDIYNEGEAISEEALNAFLKETKTSRRNLRRSFPVRKFHRHILEEFLFLNDTFRLVMSISLERPKQDPLIFRYAGEITFRGFEGRGDTAIYELLKFDSKFYKLLMQYHIPEWLKESMGEDEARRQ